MELPDIGCNSSIIPDGQVESSVKSVTKQSRTQRLVAESLVIVALVTGIVLTAKAS